MTYEEALRIAKRFGVSKVTGLPELAVVVSARCRPHALVPGMVFRGAVQRGLTAQQVRTMKIQDLGDLMFL